MKIVLNLKHEMEIDEQYFQYESRNRIADQACYMFNEEVEKFKVRLDNRMRNYLKELTKGGKRED